MKYFFANWKSNKNSAEVRSWAAAFTAVHDDAKQVIVCPPIVHLPLLHELLPTLQLGAQAVSSYPNGAYTGAVSALVLSEWARFAIAGHSERRRYFSETNQQVAQQVREILDAEMTPVLAVDQQNWSAQLSQFDRDQLKRMLVMYEPPEAISTSGQGAQAADPQRVQEMMRTIAAEFPCKAYLYGGSVNAENIASFTSLPSCSGVVVGAASLDAKNFAELVSRG